MAESGEEGQELFLGDFVGRWAGITEGGLISEGVGRERVEEALGGGGDLDRGVVATRKPLEGGACFRGLEGGAGGVVASGREGFEDGLLGFRRGVSEELERSCEVGFVAGGGDGLGEVGHEGVGVAGIAEEFVEHVDLSLIEAAEDGVIHPAGIEAGACELCEGGESLLVLNLAEAEGELDEDAFV
ncbi:MAG: hypothetical protein RI897_624 [Verrucomicrobiota bacterium]